MGTAVLSPKDCLSSSHTRHDQSLMGMIYPSTANVPKSSRALQRSVHTVLPPVSSEYSKLNPLASSPVAVSLTKDGFAHVNEFHAPLPVPHNLMHPTPLPVSSKFSFSSFSSPARMRSRVLSPCKVYPDSSCRYSKSVVLTSRSLSTAPLPQSSHDTSSSRESRHLSTGRQATRFSPQSSIQHKVGFAYQSRFQNGALISNGISDKRITDRKFSGSDESVFDLKKRTQGDLMNGYSDGDYLKWSHPRHTDTERNGERGDADKVIIGNDSDAGCLPGAAVRSNSVMRIIQRPKTKEAALEVLAKFRWKVEPSGVVGEEMNVLNNSKGDVSCSTDLAGLLKNTNDVDRACTNTGADFASSERQTVLTVGAVRESSNSASKERGRVKLPKNGSLGKANSDVLSVSGKIPSSKDETATDGNCRGVPKVSPSVASKERWAGPAYSNSPPPSSLPFPRFSIKPPKVSSLEVLSGEDQEIGISAGLALLETESSPTSLSFELEVSQIGSSSYESVDKSAIDAAFATKNLRRILNLDTY